MNRWKTGIIPENPIHRAAAHSAEPIPALPDRSSPVDTRADGRADRESGLQSARASSINCTTLPMTISAGGLTRFSRAVSGSAASVLR